MPAMRQSIVALLISLALVVTAGEPLPRVLIVGDSISIAYTPLVATAMQGVAEVVHHDGNAMTSRNAVEKMPGWLAAGSWTVVHVNVGLWDLAREKDADPAVPLDEYLANLRRLVALARAAKARVVFATTTPVPAVNAKKRRQEDVETYNRAAVALMVELAVPIDDLHAVVSADREQLWVKPGDVHFAKAGYQRLATAVAAAVRVALAAAPALSAP